MNWNKATRAEIDAKIDEAMDKGRGVTVSPAWLRQVVRDHAAMKVLRSMPACKWWLLAEYVQDHPLGDQADELLAWEARHKKGGV